MQYKEILYSSKIMLWGNKTLFQMNVCFSQNRGDLHETACFNDFKHYHIALLNCFGSKRTIYI